MKLRPATDLLFTAHGCPYAFDLIDADNPSQPAQIVGRATYVAWCDNDVIVYRVEIPREDHIAYGQLNIAHPCSKVRHKPSST